MIVNLQKPVVYVTRDIERALGMEPSGSYFVISNDTAYGRKVREAYPDNVLLVRDRGETSVKDTEVSPRYLDTYDLLLMPEVQREISDRDADLLVFQNTPRIERLAKEKGWSLLNPSAMLSREVEEKVSQVAWLGEDASLLPPHRIALAKDARFEGAKFVLQWNHSHTGEGTYVIDSAEALSSVASRFPDRECRITRFVEGPVFTVNSVVAEAIIVGNPSYQITGLAPFTDLPFSTIGNDWDLPRDEEYAAVSEEVRKMAIRVGERLRLSGWYGLFGIDAVYDEKAGKTYLLEINARQPASTTLESKLQKSDSIFEAHLSALLGLPAASGPEIRGAQIVKRVTREAYSIDEAALSDKGLSLIGYENTEHNKEILRIQSERGIMRAHNKLNDLGISIASCIRKI
ncbi:MAG: ATP-grasp domain-containing protein [Candidatus Taylorbacteria bacterium]|nr:ATP-grasp domain-containing protein [Candidatus Taylorbacteria bacterium]